MSFYSILCSRMWFVCWSSRNVATSFSTDSIWSQLAFSCSFAVWPAANVWADIISGSILVCPCLQMRDCDRRLSCANPHDPAGGWYTASNGLQTVYLYPDVVHWSHAASSFQVHRSCLTYSRMDTIGACVLVGVASVNSEEGVGLIGTYWTLLVLHNEAFLKLRPVLTKLEDALMSPPSTPWPKRWFCIIWLVKLRNLLIFCYGHTFILALTLV